MRGRIAEITDSSVFDYGEEVIVELVGRDAEGEVSAVSYGVSAAFASCGKGQ